MTNKINYLIKESQEIVREAYHRLYSSPNDHEGKENLESAAEKIHSLFEKNQKIICVSKDLPLEEQAVEYVKNHSVLKPFLSQLFPEVQFPEVTPVFVTCDSDTDFEKKEHLESDQETQHTIYSAQLEFEKIKVEFQKEKCKDWQEAISELKDRITPLFEEGFPPSSREESQEQSLNYPIYLSPFVHQLALVVLDQYLKEVENELAKDIRDMNMDLIKNPLMSSLMLLSVPNIPHLLFDKMERIFNLCSEERKSILIQYIADYVYINIHLFIPILKVKDTLFSQDILFEVAKIAATQNAETVSEHIKDYGLKDPNHLFEIAKIAAAQSGWGVSVHIQNYDLQDPDRLFEIAKIAAAQSGAGVSEPIQNYGLDPDRRFEIAKIAAAQNGWGLSEYIQNYDLDPDRLFEIAKIAAAQSGWGVSGHIRNYGLQDPDRLFEIAKIAAAQSGLGVSQNMRNYGLEEPRKLLAIFLIALHQSLSSEVIADFKRVITHFESYHLPYHELFETLDLLSQENPDASAVSKAIQAFAETRKWTIDSLLGEITKLKNATGQTDLFIWLSHFLGTCLLEDLLSDQFHFLSKENFIQSAISLRDPTFCYTLTRAMLQLAKDATAQKFVADYLNTPFYKTSRIEPYKRLPLLLISSLYAQGEKISKDICHKLVTISGNKNFQDLGHLRDLLRGLNAIIQTDQLTTQDKEHLLSVIIDKSRFPQKEGGRPVKKTQETDIFKLLKNLGTVDAVIALKATLSLKREALVAKGNDLSTTSLQEIFQSHLPIKAIADFEERYQRCFGNARLPHYILQYIAVIERSPANEKESLMSTLVTCVEAILEDNLESLRYDMDQSLHLKTIFSTRKDLFEAWKKAEVRPLSDFLEQSAVQKQQVDLLKVLYRKIITDGHLDPERVPHLTQFLKSPSPESYAQILDQIKTSSSLLENSEEHLLLLKVQSSCIQLTNPKWDLSEKKNILDEILQHLRLIPNADLFTKDISGLLLGLSSKQAKSYEGYKIMDTDKAQDLFLCGTEVPESCQRISGEQSLNKCLMGYVLDGKNRLIEVKDPPGKLIARHILHILWDGVRQEPVLFLERLYPSVVAPEIQEALLSFAKSRAKALGIPLLSKECGNGVSYPNPVQSLGSRAPFEYSDAGGGVIANGRFRVDNVRQLYPS
jgi:hypothetical protein